MSSPQELYKYWLKQNSKTILDSADCSVKCVAQALKNDRTYYDDHNGGKNGCTLYGITVCFSNETLWCTRGINPESNFCYFNKNPFYVEDGIIHLSRHPQGIQMFPEEIEQLKEKLIYTEETQDWQDEKYIETTILLTIDEFIELTLNN